MNAVADAFNRRRLTRRFKQGGQSVELDTLLNENTKGLKDDDDYVKPKDPPLGRTLTVPRPCFLFQSGACHYPQFASSLYGKK